MSTCGHSQVAEQHDGAGEEGPDDDGLPAEPFHDGRRQEHSYAAESSRDDHVLEGAVAEEGRDKERALEGRH